MKEIKVSFSISLSLDRCDVNYLEDELLRKREVGKQKDVVYVLVDSTGVNDRESGEWMEAKVGVVFSERALVSKNGVEILDKRSYGSFEGGRGIFREVLFRVYESRGFGGKEGCIYGRWGWMDKKPCIKSISWVCVFIRSLAS
jgi:hypothetical protein